MIISIVTINYNNKNGLEQTIQSVINQSYKEVDFIIIDGNSKDGSKEVINKYETCFSYSVSEPDSGIYQAMNKGIAKAKGEYILFLNSGDSLYNNSVIETIIPYLNETDVVSGDIQLEELNGKTHHLKSKSAVTLDFFFNISLYHQATFIKSSLFTDYGLHNETLKFAGDYEFFIRTLYKHNCSYRNMNVIVAHFKADGMSNNIANLSKIKAESKQAWLLNVSERTYNTFDNYYKLLQTDEVYLKTRSPLYRFSTKLSKFFFSIRLYFYKKIKETK